MRFRKLLAVALVATATFSQNPASWAEEVEGGRFEPTTRGTRPEVTQWRELVEEYDWPVVGALRVIDCESRGDPLAVNPYSGAKGLFQLLGWDRLAGVLFGSRDTFDPRVNIAMAYYLWRDSGGRFMHHWASSIGCWWW